MWLAAATAFNLVCSGTMSHESYFDKGSEPFIRTLRIDLHAKKYCDGDCKAQFDIEEVQPSFIRLKKLETDTPRERRFIDETIDRETGRYSGLRTSGTGTGILIMKWEGQCEKADFTGFPDLETKF
jgi:hypothetical protein